MCIRDSLAGQIAALRFTHIRLAIAFHALQHIRRIPALERLDHAIVDFPHRFADLVQEPAIVGHEQQSALAFEMCIRDRRKAQLAAAEAGWKSLDSFKTRTK